MKSEVPPHPSVVVAAQTGTLAEAKAGSESSMLGALAGMAGMMGGGCPPHTHETGGSDINLISKNKHVTGKGKPASGGDGWIGKLPGMDAIKDLFAAQVSSESSSENDDSIQQELKSFLGLP